VYDKVATWARHRHGTMLTMLRLWGSDSEPRLDEVTNFIQKF